MADKRRAVGAIRLSSLTEDTTSPERQKTLIQAFADANEIEIIGWAIDLDVSAGIPPWDRPELGQWLKRPDEFELLIFAKLDRAVRRLRDFVDLDEWTTDHAVDLVVLDPPLDLTTSSGRLMARVLAIFAEFEREMIAQRTKEGYEEILRQGRWPGGRVPYGYTKTQIPGRKGWYLVIDPEQAEVIRGVVDRIIGGASTLSQAKRLNEEGIPTARDGKGWAYTALYDILRSPSLLGQRKTADGDVVRHPDGMPVQYADPILTRAQWERLQDKLKDNAQNKTGSRSDAAPLLQVAFCGRCERPMYRRGVKKENAKGEMVPYFYYRCASTNDTTVETCPDKPYRSHELESVVYGEFLAKLGSMEVERRVYVPGEDHTEALETAQAAYDALTTQLTITKSAGARERITAQLTALDEQIAELETLPNRPASWRYEGTGQTYGELWETLDDAERGANLREAGVKVMVRRTVNGTPAVGLALPQDLADRVKAWAAAR
ncbi:recombinase family protein [Spirillospora sp. NPDC000708]